MASLQILDQCQRILVAYFREFASLKDKSLTISTKILNQFSKDDTYDRVRFLNQLSESVNKFLKYKQLYTSTENDIEYKLKLNILSLEELLKDANFSQQSISIILSNKTPIQLILAMKNSQKNLKITKQQREKRIRTLNAVIENKKQDELKAATLDANSQTRIGNLFGNNEASSVNILHLDDQQPQVTSLDIDFGNDSINDFYPEYQNDLNQLCEEFEMSDVLKQEINGKIDIAIQNDVFELDFIPTIIKKAIPAIYKGSIMSFYGRKIAQFLSRIKDSIIKDIADKKAILESLINKAKIGPVFISEVKQFIKMGALKQSFSQSLNL